MCGIVGYIGNKDAYPILIKGLKRLEYRGYDSARVALINENQDLNVYKTKGKSVISKILLFKKTFLVILVLPIRVGLLMGNLVLKMLILIILLPKT